MRNSNLVAAIVAAISSLAPVAAEAAADQGDRPASPYIQCDGETGHVSAGARVLRLLAVTATAGLSEAAVQHDNPAGRLTGLAAAEACDRAIASESEQIRRARLGFARTIHFIEAHEFDRAVTSARDYPAQIGARGSEWAIARTLGATASLLEADALLRAGRPEESEDAAVRAGQAAGLEPNALSRVVPYLSQTPRLPEAKRQLLATMAHVIPEALVFEARAHAWAGDYASAAAMIGAYVETLKAAYPPDFPGFYEALAAQAVYTALSGNLPRAQALGSAARDQLAAALSAGRVSNERRAPTEEMLAMVDVVALHADGHVADALRAFSSRGEWRLVSRDAVVAVAERLAAGASPQERVGLLARDPAEISREEFVSRANRIGNVERIPRLYGWAAHWAVDSDYSRHAQRVWDIGGRPRFLVRNAPPNLAGFGPLRIEQLSNTVWATGSLADGEELLLHAALIARSRGLTGFAIVPPRTQTTELKVRFGNVGDDGFPLLTAFRAEDVIGALAPHIARPPEH
jgi:hypothetical protein